MKSLINSLLPSGHAPREYGEAYAPANIALCKYWGKRDEALKLPRTGSLSVSMGAFGTHMRLLPAKTDSLCINGMEFPADDKASRRLFGFLDLLRGPDVRLRVESRNTIPMAAGLASSASAFAAAVKAMDALYDWQLDGRSLSILARLGSGSASRSVYEGFVEWHEGVDPAGMDSFAEPVAPVWPDFRVGILTLSEAEKAVGSSEGMKRTVETATLYRAWPEQVARDLPEIRRAVRSHDFPALGRTAENNALAMHATMIAAWPPVLYWRPETVAALHAVHRLRSEGVDVYATMDAGPNVKLLFLSPNEARIQETFPDMKTVSPSEAK